MVALHALEIMVGSSLWADGIWLPNTSVVELSETFVVSVCCSDTMGQLSSETAGLPSTGGIGN